MCLANKFLKKSDAPDPQVLHMMNFKTSVKTSYLVATDAEQVVNEYISLNFLVCSIAEHFASCALFWRARMASKNTNNATSEMIYSRTVLRGFFIC